MARSRPPKPQPPTPDEYWAGHLELRRVKAGGFRTNLGRYAHRNDHGPRFASLPEFLRPVAEAELSRLLERHRQQGKTLTSQKYASLVGNAAYIARYVRYRPKGKRCEYHRKLLRHLEYKRRVFAAFHAPAPGSSIEGPRVVTHESC